MPKPKQITKRRKGPTIVQIEGGKWYLDDFSYSICCDCMLVHRDSRKVESGHLFVRHDRDDRMTSKLRRKEGIVIVRKKP
jgi:hypothetical protein